MIAMSLDIDQLQADLAANKPSHLVATMKLLRQQQMRQKKRIHPAILFPLLAHTRSLTHATIPSHSHTLSFAHTSHTYTLANTD